MQKVLRLSLFDDPAMTHDDDPVGHVSDDGQIMGDHQQGHAVFPGEPLQEVEDLRLRRHVERGCRFVRDQQARPQGDGHGDDDPLPLPTGQLVRIARQRKSIRGQTDTRQGICRARLCLGAGGRRLVYADRFRHLLPDGLNRVQRCHRFLENHANVIAARLAKLRFGQRVQVTIPQHDAPLRPGALRHQLHDRQRRHALARAAFAGDRHDLSGVDGEADIMQRVELVDRQVQVLDGQQGHTRATRRRGSR